MDRSYAIKRIKEIQRLYSFTPAIHEALDLAIEALVLQDRHIKAVERMIEGAKEINRFLEEAAKKSDEKLQLSPKTSTISEEISTNSNKNLKDNLSFSKSVKLINPCNSLLTEDSEACKEQKSKLDCISRADAIAYIDRILNSGLGRRKSLDYIRMYVSALPSVMLDIKTFCGVPIKEAVEVLEKHKHSPSERAGECGYCPTKRDGVLTIVIKDGDTE